MSFTENALSDETKAVIFETNWKCCRHIKAFWKKKCSGRKSKNKEVKHVLSKYLERMVNWAGNVYKLIHRIIDFLWYPEKWGKLFFSLLFFSFYFIFGSSFLCWVCFIQIFPSLFVLLLLPLLVFLSCLYRGRSRFVMCCARCYVAMLIWFSIQSKSSFSESNIILNENSPPKNTI